MKVSYPNTFVDVPILTITDDLNTETYQMISKYENKASSILAWPKWNGATDDELLKSSIDFSMTLDEESYPFVFYAGMTPYGNNENGWWFGKNGGHSQGVHADGIAQAFEKPEHPYLLKQVVLMAAEWKVTSNVEMRCKIYRLNEVPDYQDNNSVVLPEDFGELIAVGVSQLRPNNGESDIALIPFTLFVPDEDNPELLLNLPITIDDAILVILEDYNAPEMSAVVNFTAMIGNEYHIDDGFGERAFVKIGRDDADGNFDGHYQWRGLNNLFSSGEMKTGFSIFLTTDLPFLCTNYASDDYQYTFSADGGMMEKTLTDENGESVTMSSIEIASWKPTKSGEFSITCNGGDLPGWLSVFATDSTTNGEYNYLINAQVIAQPMDEGTDYREAIVRFAIPGTYMDYKFVQTRLDGADSTNVAPVMGYSLDLPDMSVAAGDTVILPISMSNEGDVVALQTYIKLPEGFELLSDNGKYVITLSDRACADHTYLALQLPNGMMRVSCYSPSHIPFVGNGGELLYLTVKVPWNASGDYAVELSNTCFTLGDFTEYDVETVVDATLSVYPSYDPWDVNGDGEVTVADANSVVVIIINGGHSSGGHSREPGDGDDDIIVGDVNGDGEVTIADFNAIVNYILRN